MSKTVPPYPQGKNLLAGRNVVVTAAAGTGIGTLTFDGVRDIVAANSEPVPVG